MHALGSSRETRAAHWRATRRVVIAERHGDLCFRLHACPPRRVREHTLHLPQPTFQQAHAAGDGSGLG